MLKMNRKVEYALIALKCLSDNPGKKISAREICDEFHIPFDTTSKVMQILNNHGILKSEKGIKGGYIILKSLYEMSFSELVKIIEGKDEFGPNCSSPTQNCELITTCNISGPISNLNNMIFQFLSDLTVGDLLHGNKLSDRLLKNQKMMVSAL